MSDFTSNFWSIYVVALTLGGIFGCLLLLWMTARKKVESAADNTTGHVWDGDLMEMNNPMPRWWMWLFVITSFSGWATWRFTPDWVTWWPARLVSARCPVRQPKSTRPTRKSSRCMHALRQHEA
jgi:hypothetical protein